MEHKQKQKGLRKDSVARLVAPANANNNNNKKVLSGPVKVT